MEKKEILVFSIALGGYSHLFKSCLETQKQYCSKYGYQYVLVDNTPRKLLPTEAAWLKLYLLRLAMECDYKWVVFLDADCEVREHTPSFIKELSGLGIDKSIFMAQGFSGRINSGVIFLKNTLASYNYLNKVIGNKNREVPPEDKALYENGHMIHYAKENTDIQIIDYSLWNNNRNLNDKSYIQHYSGGILRKGYLQDKGHLESSRLMKRILKKILLMLPKKSSSNSQDLQEILPFFAEKYPAFSCSQNGTFKSRNFSQRH